MAFRKRHIFSNELILQKFSSFCKFQKHLNPSSLPHWSTESSVFISSTAANTFQFFARNNQPNDILNLSTRVTLTFISYGFRMKPRPSVVERLCTASDVVLRGCTLRCVIALLAVGFHTFNPALVSRTEKRCWRGWDKVDENPENELIYNIVAHKHSLRWLLPGKRLQEIMRWSRKSFFGLGNFPTQKCSACHGRC